MPDLDNCINFIYEPGNIGASSGAPPVIIRRIDRVPRSLAAESGSYALTGSAANVRPSGAAKLLIAGGSSYALTGSTALITKPAPDPNFANVKLLLGFEGANASTGAPGMTDQSPSARGTASIVGASQISTAQHKFGGSSLLLDGLSDYISFPDSADWDFGTGQFTIEGYFRFVATPVPKCVLIAHWSGGWALFFETGGLRLRAAAGTDTTVYSWTPTLNQWYAIAVDRDASNVARIYVDGAMVSKTTSYTASLTGSTAVLAIGSLIPGGFSGYDLNGYVDEVRITAGVARYASDAGYTVATAPFPRS